METTDLEEISGETEAIVERQELPNEQMNIDTVGSLEDRHIFFLTLLLAIRITQIL
jgi:hypothetical protein